MTNKEGMEINRRILGTILTIVGGSFTLLAVWTLYRGFHGESSGAVEFPFGGMLFFMEVLTIGVPLFVLGIFLMLLKGKVESHRIWGWIEVILGMSFIAWSCYFLSLLIYVIHPEPLNAILSDLESQNRYFGPELLIGIPLLIHGIWQTVHKKNTPPTNPGGMDNPLGEVRK